MGHPKPHILVVGQDFADVEYFKRYRGFDEPDNSRFWAEGAFYLPIAERAKREDQSIQNCSCMSACALIWFGAAKRFGVVGLHRPRTTDSAFKSLPPGEASTVYKQKLDAIVRYLNEMEVPKPMIDAMVATSSADI